MTLTAPTPETILDFWFREATPRQWWLRSDDFDRRIESRFGDLQRAAERCELYRWRATPVGRLAEIIVLDQFSRNLYRDQPRAFASDGLALALAQSAVAAHADGELDAARRVAVAGFLALAPDGLFPVGGYPGNDDDGRSLQASLDPAKLRTDLLNSARFIRAHKMSSGKLGVTGFCYGGGVVSYLATALGPEMHAGVPYYGVAADTASVPKIKAPLLCHLAEHDERINATYPAFEAALKAAGVPYQVQVYPGTQHGFHNNSTPRYNEAAANLSWERTLAHFRTHLA